MRTRDGIVSPNNKGNIYLGCIVIYSRLRRASGSPSSSDRCPKDRGLSEETPSGTIPILANENGSHLPIFFSKETIQIKPVISSVEKRRPWCAASTTSIRVTTNMHPHLRKVVLSIIDPGLSRSDFLLGQNGGWISSHFLRLKSQRGERNCSEGSRVLKCRHVGELPTPHKHFHWRKTSRNYNDSNARRTECDMIDCPENEPCLAATTKTKDCKRVVRTWAVTSGQNSPR